MSDSKQEIKADIISRLKKIEGQVKGIQKMVDEEKCCSDVMLQIAAIRSAINRVGGIMMDRYIRECMVDTVKSTSAHTDEELENLIETIVRYVK